MSDWLDPERTKMVCIGLKMSRKMYVIIFLRRLHRVLQTCKLRYKCHGSSLSRACQITFYYTRWVKEAVLY